VGSCALTRRHRLLLTAHRAIFSSPGQGEQRGWRSGPTGPSPIAPRLGSGIWVPPDG
jgi:hypothetical protein